MKRNLLLGWISLFGVLAFAQEDPVVMRINGKDIPRSEFEYSYRRHADGNGMKLSPKEYAEFFIQSKLKVEAARAAGLDTTSAFRKQQEAYRTNLLRSYLLDDQEMDGNARILYQKMKEMYVADKCRYSKFTNICLRPLHPGIYRRNRLAWTLFIR